MAKEPMQVPVYLFLGLLESGKTSVIKDFLSSNKFSGRDKNLIILCEEGETELPEALVKRSRAVTEIIEEPEDFTAGKLAALDREHRPTAVMLEYNGMWKVTDLDDIDLPPGWFIFQVVATVNAETFEIYQQNMKDKIVDCYRYADVIVFNRCDSRTRQQDIRRNIRAVNRRIPASSRKNRSCPSILKQILSRWALTISAPGSSICRTIRNGTRAKR